MSALSELTTWQLRRKLTAVWNDMCARPLRWSEGDRERIRPLIPLEQFDPVSAELINVFYARYRAMSGET